MYKHDLSHNSKLSRIPLPIVTIEMGLYLIDALSALTAFLAEIYWTEFQLFSIKQIFDGCDIF